MTATDTTRKLAELLALLRQAHAVADELRDLPEEDVALMFADVADEAEREPAAAWLKEDAQGTAYTLDRALGAVKAALPAGAASLADRLRVEVAEEEADPAVTVG